MSLLQNSAAHHTAVTPYLRMVVADYNLFSDALEDVVANLNPVDVNFPKPEDGLMVKVQLQVRLPATVSSRVAPKLT